MSMAVDVERRTVLLVEDDADLAETLRGLLVDEGYDVVTAANGLEALNVLQTAAETPALIVLDLMLPVMSGWEFMDVVRSDARFSEIPVIITTATQATAPEGAQRYFQKPLKLEALLDAVSTHTERQ